MQARKILLIVARGQVDDQIEELLEITVRVKALAIIVPNRVLQLLDVDGEDERDAFVVEEMLDAL